MLACTAWLSVSDALIWKDDLIRKDGGLSNSQSSAVYSTHTHCVNTVCVELYFFCLIKDSAFRMIIP